jgi:hypothetical protein
MDKEELSMREHIDRKVSWTQFWAITGAVISLALIVAGYQSNRLDKLSARVDTIQEQNTDTKVALATISTQLAQIQKDILELKALRTK